MLGLGGVAVAVAADAANVSVRAAAPAPGLLRRENLSETSEADYVDDDGMEDGAAAAKRARR